MKILHLDSGREMRGGQWQVLRLHQTLVEAGHESFLLGREGAPLLAMANKRGLPCQALRPLRLALLSRSFDIVHAHDSRSHTWGAVFARVPLVVARRVAFPVGDSLGSRWKYGRARRFLAVSHFVAERLIEAGVDFQRIDIVYDGVDVPAVPACGDDILAPFTLDPAKGMTLAKEAASLAGVPLVCSENLDRDLPHAQTLLYLTQSEGLGSGILLAMAHGVAVVASRIGGVPELIDDGVTGLLVQNEANAVAQAILRATPAMGHAAREAVLNRFTVNHMVLATLDCYRKALSE